MSAHPDVILKMGVKEVLHRTRHLGWGADTHRYDSKRLPRRIPVTLADEWPARTQAEPRERRSRRLGKPCRIRTRRFDCSTRSAVVDPRRYRSTLSLPAASRISDGARCIVDQAFQPRLPEGMIRCYMSGLKVAGFGHQLIKGSILPPPEGRDSPEAQPGPRIMHGPDAPSFQVLRGLMEDKWTPQLMETLDIDERRCRSSGTRTSSTARVMWPAPTRTSYAKSTRIYASQSPTRRRRRSHGRSRTAFSL